MQLEDIKRQLDNTVAGAKEKLGETVAKLDLSNLGQTGALVSVKLEQMRSEQLEVLLALGQNAHQKLIQTHAYTPVALQRPVVVLTERLGGVLETLRALQPQPMVSSAKTVGAASEAAAEMVAQKIGVQADAPPAPVAEDQQVAVQVELNLAEADPKKTKKVAEKSATKAAKPTAKSKKK